MAAPRGSRPRCGCPHRRPHRGRLRRPRRPFPCRFPSPFPQPF
ncbi:hypothetical protein STRAU_2410 [Streptomyces aurantiacus JA 4570]|uniref:Uncharacterized protein n=1 Tax=Streptomyces aurantiacus JA 4570 TaxID=1286094 RepID=S3ZMV7_9ACTN|nr:hypothetical protein STRAU_2410 [Streptomyces aurantiacus JA 4570]